MRTGEKVKETKEYTIFKKSNGRYGVLGAKRNWIKGEEKIKALSAAKLIKAAPKKKAPEPVAEEAAAEAPATEEAKSE